jgi:hypothetical protein
MLGERLHVQGGVAGRSKSGKVPGKALPNTDGSRFLTRLTNGRFRDVQSPPTGAAINPTFKSYLEWANCSKQVAEKGHFCFCMPM